MSGTSHIADKKRKLDLLRPLSAAALARLDHYYDIEVTYSSNGLEGNTLTAVETTLVIEMIRILPARAGSEYPAAGAAELASINPDSGLLPS
ncbi:MAG: hypothetical protein IT168_00105 [Bryobacterales bacterium]|nr:hypothetical protein [Bryobacterales bacterium]